MLPGRNSRLLKGWKRRADVPLLLEAHFWLAVFWLALRLRPFQQVVAGLRRPAAAQAMKADVEKLAQHVSWAVRIAVRIMPWPMVCFPQGLAAHRMLRRRGIDAILHYGLSNSGDDELNAHVWVSVGTRIITGAESKGAFVEVARFSARKNGVDQ